MKLGTLDISACKFGTQDPQIYLGTTKIYPTEPTPPAEIGKMYAVYSDNTSYSLSCDTSTTLTQAEVSAHTTALSSMTSVIIGDCVETIATDAFKRASTLSSATIGSAVTRIEQQAFQYCNLQNVVIPSGVTFVGNFAFDSNRNIQSVTIYATTPPSCGLLNPLPFGYANPIYVPSGSISAYQTTSRWANYSSLYQAIP